MCNGETKSYADSILVYLRFMYHKVINDFHALIELLFKHIFVAHRDKVAESLRYTPRVGVHTWLRFLMQVHYISYNLSYLQQTCMDDAS